MTISDVAAALGVAVSTVSNAYNRPDQLSATLRAQVFKVAEQHGYTEPDPVARSLRQQLSYAFTDAAATLVLAGIASALEAAALGLLLLPGRDESTATVQWALVDGFVAYSMLTDDPLVEAALYRRLPMVVIDQPPRPHVPAVTVDDAYRACRAAEHLSQPGPSPLRDCDRSAK